MESQSCFDGHTEPLRVYETPPGRHAGVTCSPGPGAGSFLSLSLPDPAALAPLLPATLSSPRTCLRPTPAPSGRAQGAGGWRGDVGGEGLWRSGFAGLLRPGDGSPRDGTPALRPQTSGGEKTGTGAGNKSIFIKYARFV